MLRFFMAFDPDHIARRHTEAVGLEELFDSQHQLASLQYLCHDCHHFVFVALVRQRPATPGDPFGAVEIPLFPREMRP